MKRSFNYTDRKKIPIGAVAVAVVQATPEAIPTFDADLSGLAELDFDPHHRIVLEPYVVATTMRFDCGLIGNPELPQDRRLTDLDQGGAIRFRVLVIDESTDPCRIVASGKITVGDEDEESQKSILRLTETPSLGEQLWRLDLDDEAMPELLVNSKVPGFKGRLLKDPLVQGLIFPAVIRELLAELLRGAVTDDVAWAAGWLTYAKRLTGRDKPENEEDFEEYISDCVNAFAEHQKFSSRIVEQLKGDESD